MTPRLAGIRLVVVDVDGVLTDGIVPYDAAGLRMGFFSARDGMAVTLCLGAGLELAVVSGAQSRALARRCRDLGIRHLHQGVEDKSACLAALQARLGIGREATLYVGDDLNDLPAFACAGVAVAVADAAPEVRAAADWTTREPGGRGAVREVVDAVLRAQGTWESTVATLFGASAVAARRE